MSAGKREHPRLSRVLVLPAALLLSLSLAMAPRAAASPAAGTLSAGRGRPAALVDPFIGTGGNGQTWPGPMVPFGMTQWSPMTEPASASGSGYGYASSTISGFSLTAFSAGVPAPSDISFMPYLGTPSRSPELDLPAYHSPFSHQNERAQAGYYSVTLDRPRTRVELTAADRANLGRFTFPPAEQATLLVRSTGRPAGAVDAGFRVIDRHTIEGTVARRGFGLQGRNAAHTVHFTTVFDRPFAAFGGWSGDRLTPGTAAAAGGKSGLYLVFDTTTHATVTAKTAISYVGRQGAAGNLAADAPDFDFDAMRARAWRAWNRQLGRVRVEGGTEPAQQIFYTALYHALTQPNIFSDVNGQYRGFDDRVHRTAGWTQYANFSGWDVYRSWFPLISMVAPKVAGDFAQSLVVDGRQGGGLPRWSPANDEAGTMTGNPGAIALAEAYAFGARRFDTRAALRLMVDGATRPGALNNGYLVRPGLDRYLRDGYIPAREPQVWGPTGTTLEYATADNAVARFARALGDEKTYGLLAPRAQNWQHVFNPGTGFVQNRAADGSFDLPFDPAYMARNGFAGGYAEGNATTYTFMVPHNPAGLIAALGGDGPAVSRLDAFFSTFRGKPNTPYANLGNEPTHNSPWLYNWAGAPAKTQATVRRALLELFTTGPAGLFGNDDLGATSAWGVWAALGLYPAIPGVGGLAVHSPLFPKITITLAGGTELRIKAPAASAGTSYVRGLRLDGRPFAATWLDWDRIARHGADLDFDLTPTPTRWAEHYRPPSFTAGQAPGIGYFSADRLSLAPGATATVTFGVRNLRDQSLTVTWRPRPPAGLVVSPSQGRLVVPAGGRREVTLTLGAGRAAADGARAVDLGLRTQAGRRLPQAAVRVSVARPGDLVPHFDNNAVVPDDRAASSRFEFLEDRGAGFSAEALAALGVTPGSTVTADGFRYLWPDVPVGRPDNMVVAGQTIALSPRPGAQRLGFLGATTIQPAEGTGTVTYSDGTSERFRLGLSHWTLDASSFQGLFRGGGTVRYGNVPALTTTSINDAWYGHGTGVNAYLFSAAVPLRPGKTVTSVTLPTSDDGGEMHVFAIAQA